MGAACPNTLLCDSSLARISKTASYNISVRASIKCNNEIMLSLTEAKGVVMISGSNLRVSLLIVAIVFYLGYAVVTRNVRAEFSKEITARNNTWLVFQELNQHWEECHE